MIRELSQSALRVASRQVRIINYFRKSTLLRSMNAPRDSLCIMSLTIMSLLPLSALAQNHEAHPRPLSGSHKRAGTIRWMVLR